MRKNRNYKRKAPFRDARLFVIFCEGAKTEKIYFEAFTRNSQRIKVKVFGNQEHKSAPFHILENALNHAEPYDFLYLVIDTDRWKHQIAEVAQKCEQKKFGFIVSNPCFEVWLYLHLPNAQENFAQFNDSCQQFEKALKNELNGFNKSNYNPTFFLENISTALENAQKLDRNPAERYPSQKGTHVYKLMQKLIEFQKNKLHF